LLSASNCAGVIPANSRNSLMSDATRGDNSAGGGTSTYRLSVWVDDIDRAEQAAKGAPVVKPRDRTFYGSTELYVRDPGGNTIGFAQFD